MGVFPEPARGVDDVSRLVPCETDRDDNNAVAWLPRAVRRNPRRSFATRRNVTLVAALLAGLSLPQTAFAPAASAHDRIDTGARAAQALAAETVGTHAPAEAAASVEAAAETWSGVPLVEQEPATTAIIAGDLDTLPRPVVDAGEDKVRFGPTSVPRKVVDTILKAAEETGMDPVYMMALADKESSFDTDVKAATSSAQGLFQFVANTWLEMIRDYGARYGLAEEAASVKGTGSAIRVAGDGMRQRVLSLRNDPYVASLMAAELAKRDRGRIEAKIGRALTSTELYFAHFLGTASAGRFLVLSSDNPEVNAQKAFRQAARANRSLFTAKGRRALTVAEVYERIDGMIDKRLSRYQGVAVLTRTPDRAEPVQVVAPAASGRIQVSDALPPSEL
ncbi:transglycosylase SLT domain-containing protein [Methylobacterium dankookense]|uniref:Transglycosylase SLT domain-containing protein n=1 Tax=Methylobacterium dankookense TaxID=560405 RepID=A0A564FU55_9HYPH|nr:transglycosylase SLT domain-containing protein [Methylobacterium dankookense]GJD56570.1 hypothetical protein IFDJLNFL_2467 [Methylobacterium dankookense]VUF10961.1 hypothetical protein MTDSW087_00633 [Methylobacterium dankookense]